jgi:hypothetical protein
MSYIFDSLQCKEQAMEFVVTRVEHVVSALQAWSPMQLLIVAMVTILLGYLGIVSRMATR